MVRRSRKTSKKRSKGVYNVDVKRYSIYPSIPKPEEFKPTEKVKPGSLIEVKVDDIDEKGSGKAKYNEYKVIIIGDVNVGQKVRVRISRIHRNIIYAKVIDGKRH